jgi:hypothetical protein
MIRCVSRGAIAALLVASVAPNWRAQTRPEVPSALKTFLQEYLARGGGEVDRTTRYQFALVELDGPGKRDVIAYVTGRRWCGTGGCTMLILAPDSSSYRVVSRIPITRPPIRVLTVTSKGWRDIGVWVQGGGIQPGYEADLPFDGSSYPMNPSAPPARRLGANAAGEVVLSAAEEGTPLYP